MEFEQEILRQETALVKGIITLVLINREFKPQPLADYMLEALK